MRLSHAAPLGMNACYILGCPSSHSLTRALSWIFKLLAIRQIRPRGIARCDRVCCHYNQKVEAERSAAKHGCLHVRAEPLAQPATSLRQGDKGESSLYERHDFFAYQPARPTDGGSGLVDWMSLAVIPAREPRLGRRH